MLESENENNKRRAQREEEEIIRTESQMKENTA
jgi:hypothetical protein